MVLKAAPGMSLPAVCKIFHILNINDVHKLAESLKRYYNRPFAGINFINKGAAIKDYRLNYIA